MRCLLLLFSIAATTAALHGATFVLHADEIELLTGERLSGKVVEMTSQHVILEHPILGRLRIAADQIKFVTQLGPAPVEPQDTPPPEVSPDVSPEASPEVSAIVPEVAQLTPWLSALHDRNVQLEFGVNGARGNSDTADVRLAAKAGRETDARRWAFDTAYFYATTDGDATRNDLTLGLTNDWLYKDSPWFVFAQGRADLDDFQDWDHRVNGAAGVGYELIETDTLTARLRAGIGAVREFGSDDSTWRPEGSFGGELNWAPKKNHTLAAAVTAFPSLDDVGEVRVRASADWTLKIDQADGMSLKLGVVDEYDSLAGGTTKKNDLKYYAALVIDF